MAFFRRDTYHKGDITGDGRISASDYIDLRLTILGIKQLDGPYELAARVAGKASVTATDYINLRLNILGIKTINQDRKTSPRPHGACFSKAVALEE